MAEYNFTLNLTDENALKIYIALKAVEDNKLFLNKEFQKEIDIIMPIEEYGEDPITYIGKGISKLLVGVVTHYEFNESVKTYENAMLSLISPTKPNYDSLLIKVWQENK